MPGWLRWILSNPEVLIGIFVIGGPIFARVMKGLVGVINARRAAMDQERAAIDSLRTGMQQTAQSHQPHPQSAAARLDELAAKRRAQIETQRAARGSRGKGGGRRATPPATPPAIPNSARSTAARASSPQPPGGVVIDVPYESNADAAAAEQAKQRKMRSKQEQAERAFRDQAQRQAALAEAEASQRRAELQRSETLRKQREKAAAPAKVAERTAEARRLLMAPKGALTRADLQRNIILSELLAPPISMRG